MLKELLNRIKYGKAPKTMPQEINKEESKVLLEKNGDVLKMSILGRPSIDMFFAKVRELPKEDKDIILKLPLSVLANSSDEVNPGDYIWTTINNNSYIIMSNKDTININQTKKLSDRFEDRSVTINKRTRTFTVYKATHDSNFSTIEHRKFDSGDYGFTPSDFTLSLEEAKEEYEVLFNDLIHEEKILKELEGTIDVNNLKTSIDEHFKQIIPQHKI